MKTFLKFTALSAVLLVLVGLFFLTACERNCDTSITKPNDLLPVDWDGYNDVFTVWWNFRSNDGEPHNYLTQGRTIKIYGTFGNYSFGFNNDGSGMIFFDLVDEQERDFFDPGWVSENPYTISVRFQIHPDSLIDKDELLDLLSIWASLTKRLYIRGSLTTGAGGPHWCPGSIFPQIILNSLNDIYFETNKSQ